MAKNPQIEKAHELYKKGMKLKDIAKELGRPEGTIRRWKCSYGWDGTKKANVRSKKSERSEIKNDGTKETFENEELTDKQKLFCVYYSRTWNATQSYMNAFQSSYNVANAEGYKMLVKPCIKKELDRLKEIRRQQILATEEDLLDLNMRIAHSDIGNYVSFGREKLKTVTEDGQEIETDIEVNRVKLRDSGETDTQLIKEIKVDSKGGIAVVLKDDRKAMEWLDKHYYNKRNTQEGVIIEDDIPNKNKTQ